VLLKACRQTTAAPQTDLRSVAETGKTARKGKTELDDPCVSNGYKKGREAETASGRVHHIHLQNPGQSQNLCPAPQLHIAAASLPGTHKPHRCCSIAARHPQTSLQPPVELEIGCPAKAADSWGLLPCL